METADELKKWVESLSIAEKRFITLLGKARAGVNTSQQLELFDWLNQAAPGDPLPASARFRQNLPTVSKRLKDLILDGLRILHKEDGTDALLHTTLDEIGILISKKLYRAAIRQIKRAKKLALQTSRYRYALHCIEWEQRTAGLMVSGDTREQLYQLREEELQVLEKEKQLRELQHRHTVLLALVKQVPFHREPATLKEVNALAGHELVQQFSSEGPYLEHALAVNLLCLRDLFERKPEDARDRYLALLKEWKTHPEWQADQVDLLLTICKFFQTACFFSKANWEEAQQYIAMASGFKGLPADAERDFQRMLYHNQFTLGLNTGKFDLVLSLIPEIDKWIKREDAQLTEAQKLPFLCNFAVAEFLIGSPAASNRMVSRILNMPNRKIRLDIREFAMILQAVLQYELENDRLQEYLMRAGKRHFKKNPAELNFELLVLRHLERVSQAADDTTRQKPMKELVAELEALVEETQGKIPLLGLMEIRLWAIARSEGKQLRDVFAAEIQKNLEQLGLN